MKKLTNIILIALILLSANIVLAQDSTLCDSTKKCTCKGEFNTEIGLNSRNVWRGASYGDAPSIMGKMNYTFSG